jgi:hypothetical protein
MNPMTMNRDAINAVIDEIFPHIIDHRSGSLSRSRTRALQTAIRRAGPYMLHCVALRMLPHIDMRVSPRLDSIAKACITSCGFMCDVMTLVPDLSITALDPVGLNVADVLGTICFRTIQAEALRADMTVRDAWSASDNYEKMVTILFATLIRTTSSQTSQHTLRAIIEAVAFFSKDEIAGPLVRHVATVCNAELTLPINDRRGILRTMRPYSCVVCFAFSKRVRTCSRCHESRVALRSIQSDVFGHLVEATRGSMYCGAACQVNDYGVHRDSCKRIRVFTSVMASASTSDLATIDVARRVMDAAIDVHVTHNPLHHWDDDAIDASIAFRGSFNDPIVPAS